MEDGVDTIITCDNGIAAASEIAYGKAQGMTIIVTDHHEVPYLEAGERKEYLIPGAEQWSTRIYREILIRLKVCAVLQLRISGGSII